MLTKSKPTLYLIIPVFNEAGNIDRLLNSIELLQKTIASEFSITCLLVDDGSSDHTVDKIRSHTTYFSVITLTNPINLGPGAAFAKAFFYLSSRLKKNDWVLTMEGDNTSDITTIQHLLQRRKEGYDVVLASPYLYSGSINNVAIHRVIISQMANTLTKIILGINGILTFSCFLRLYNGATIQSLQKRFGPNIIECQGFESMVELLAKLVQMKVKISEVESIVDWRQRVGKSKMKILKTIRGYLKLFIHWHSMSKPKVI